MEEKVNKVLESVGLNKNEIKIYLDLLKHRNSSALDISKRTLVHRSNTYDALRNLINLGFIKEIIEERKRIFNAIEPEKIKDYLRQQENEVDAIMPYLKTICQECKEEDNVSVAKGVFAVRESLLNFLNMENEPISVYGASKESVELLGLGFLKEFHEKRIKKKILMRHIYDQESIERVEQLNKMKYTESKVLPKKFYSVVSTNICGDTILFIIFSGSVLSITIKNKTIADSYKKYFEILWKQAKVV